VFYASWLGLNSMVLIGVVVLGGRRKTHKKNIALGAFWLMIVLMNVGCGGGSSLHTVPGAPPGTSTVTVTGSTTTFTHSTTFNLIVRP
jgi:hypothetical protein